MVGLLDFLNEPYDPYGGKTGGFTRADQLGLLGRALSGFGAGMNSGPRGLVNQGGVLTQYPSTNWGGGFAGMNDAYSSGLQDMNRKALTGSQVQDSALRRKKAQMEMDQAAKQQAARDELMAAVQRGNPAEIAAARAKIDPMGESAPKSPISLAKDTKLIDPKTYGTLAENRMMERSTSHIDQPVGKGWLQRYVLSADKSGYEPIGEPFQDQQAMQSVSGVSGGQSFTGVVPRASIPGPGPNAPRPMPGTSFPGPSSPQMSGAAPPSMRPNMTSSPFPGPRAMPTQQGDARPPGIPPGVGLFTGGGMKEGANVKEIQRLADVSAQFNTVATQFKPEFHQLGPIVKNKVSGVAEFAGLDQSPERRMKMQEFYDYRSALTRVQADVRHDLYGAALSGNEQKTADGFLVSNTDGPTEASSKIKNFRDITTKAIARRVYAEDHGLNWEKIGLDQMPKIMNERGEQIERALIMQNVPKDEAIKRAREQVMREFGIAR